MTAELPTWAYTTPPRFDGWKPVCWQVLTREIEDPLRCASSLIPAKQKAMKFAYQGKRRSPSIPARFYSPITGLVTEHPSVHNAIATHGVADCGHLRKALGTSGVYRMMDGSVLWRATVETPAEFVGLEVHHG